MRAACAAVAPGASHVRLGDAGLERLARDIAEGPVSTPPWDRPHLRRDEVGAERLAGWVLLLDSMNFSFWEDEPRWRVGGADGYLALVAALRRAHERGVPVGDPVHDASMPVGELAGILRGDPGGPAAPPLLAERHATATSTAGWVLDAHRGSCLAAAAAGDAYDLALRLAGDLPRWRDVAEHRGRRVPLLKRAQIAAFDLGLALGEEAPSGLLDRSRLTAFADYKLPQVLREEGVLVYADGLAARVDARLELEPGSEEEVEIRALTVVAVDALAARVRDLGRDLDAPSLDAILWWRAQLVPPRRPYHRCRTIWY